MYFFLNHYCILIARFCPKFSFQGRGNKPEQQKTNYVAILSRLGYFLPFTIN